MEAEYLWHGLTSGTRGSYRRGGAIPRGVCKASRMACTFSAGHCGTGFDVDCRGAHRIVASGQTLYKKTLKRKISALSSWHTDLGLPSTNLYGKRVQRVIAGANRYHGVSKKKQPLPTTHPILRKMIATIRADPYLFGDEIDSLAIIAAFTLAFACFMRMDELTYDVFDPKFHLSRSSFVLRDKHEASLITFESSKGDQARKGWRWWCQEVWTIHAQSGQFAGISLRHSHENIMALCSPFAAAHPSRGRQSSVTWRRLFGNLAIQLLSSLVTRSAEVPRLGRHRSAYRARTSRLSADGIATVSSLMLMPVPNLTWWQDNNSCSPITASQPSITPGFLDRDRSGDQPFDSDFPLCFPPLVGACFLLGFAMSLGESGPGRCIFIHPNKRHQRGGRRCPGKSSQWSRQCMSFSSPLPSIPAARQYIAAFHRA